MTSRTLTSEPEHPEKHAEQLDDLYKELDGKPLFTMEVIRHAADAYEALSPDNPTCSLKNTKGEVHDGFDHQAEHLKLPRGMCEEKERLSIGFFTYLDVATDLDSWQLPGHVESKTESTCLKLAKARIPIYALPCSYETEKPLREADLEQARIAYQKDDTRARVLNSLVKAHLEVRPSKISKIVCLESDSSALVDESQNFRWNLYHHLLAFDIARVLLQQYYSDDIEIVFPDRKYTQQNHDWLKKVKANLKVRFVGTPRGILEVDKNTLVLARGSPEFPVRQIIVDVTKPFGGPAGFFCQTIPKIPETDHEIAYCYQSKFDPANRHVASMEKDYNMKATCTSKDWGYTLYLKQA